MKVALSASHGNHPEAIKILADCDLIYTTQVKNYYNLRDEFPSADIRVIPDCSPAMIEFLKSRHEHDEIVSFSDLFAARRGTTAQG